MWGGGLDVGDEAGDVAVLNVGDALLELGDQGPEAHDAGGKGQAHFFLGAEAGRSGSLEFGHKGKGVFHKADVVTILSIFDNLLQVGESSNEIVFTFRGDLGKGNEFSSKTGGSDFLQLRKGVEDVGDEGNIVAGLSVLNDLLEIGKNSFEVGDALG